MNLEMRLERNGPASCRGEEEGGPPLRPGRGFEFTCGSVDPAPLELLFSLIISERHVARITF